MHEWSAQQIWETALGELQVQVSKPNYQTWLAKTVGLSYQDGEFTIGTPNAFVAEYLDKNQRSLIEKTVIGLTEPDIKVTFQVNGKHHSWSDHYNGENACPAVAPKFNPRYTFDSFIASTCNRLARDAALSVAQNPGANYNPLFICGGAGLGKTHLLHAIGHIALAKNIRILYVSAEQFTNEFINAIREKRTGEFHNKYRSVDMLLIDDIHFIIGKEQTEESFFHTFNELHDANRQIVITSDRPPKCLSALEERLCSRFEWGLVADIQPPDFETCLAILQAKAKDKATPVSLDVLELIAHQGPQNVRRLEGALNRVIAYAMLFKSAPTLELAAQALGDIAQKEPEAVNITPDLIIEVVAGTFQLSPADLKSKKRAKEVSLARHLAMYLIRKETSCSLAEIGKVLGNRDHSTVTHACEIMASAVDASPFLKRRVLDIQRMLYHGPSATN